jgi:hypothetical protein
MAGRQHLPLRRGGGSVAGCTIPTSSAGDGACSVRRSVTAQQAGLDPEDDTEGTIDMLTRHAAKP